MCVGLKRNETQVSLAVGRKQHEQRKMLDTLKVYSSPKKWISQNYTCSLCIHMLFYIVKLYLLRLCGEKTIFKLFIFETAEYQLSSHLL